MFEIVPVLHDKGEHKYDGLHFDFLLALIREVGFSQQASVKLYGFFPSKVLCLQLVQADAPYNPSRYVSHDLELNDLGKKLLSLVCDL